MIGIQIVHPSVFKYTFREPVHIFEFRLIVYCSDCILSYCIHSMRVDFRVTYTIGFSLLPPSDFEILSLIQIHLNQFK